MSDYEASILGYLTNPQDIRKIWDSGIRQEHFRDPKNAEAFQFAIDQWISDGMAERVVSASTIKEKFGVETELPEAQEPISTVVGALKTRFDRDQLGTVLKDATLRMSKGEVDGLSSEVIDRLADIQRKQRARTQVITTKDVSTKRSLYADLLEASTKEKTGAPFGFPEIDERIGGTRPGELTVVAAYSGIGKSNLLGWSAVKAQESGHKVLFVTLEMSPQDIAMRMDAYASRLPMSKIASPTEENQLSFLREAGRSQSEFEIWHAAQDKMAEFDNPITIIQPAVGERSVAQIVALAREYDVDYLIIDQLSHVEDKAGSGFRDRRERHGDRIMDLKDLISDTTVKPLSCMLAVQMNRQSQQNRGKKGEMWNLAESADVERTADIIIGLSADKTDRQNNYMRYEELKLRRGQRRAYYLNWYFNPYTEFSVSKEIIEDEGGADE